ncbi:MAG: cache domain-containing protein [Candidatus Didemnitutus sp.]|nr:cache domain-containing protein [Candidatus Didemnitutus sp.]
MQTGEGVAPESLPAEWQEKVAAAVEPLRWDLHRTEEGTILLEHLAPIRDEAGNFAGVVVLASDARRTLYPLIEDWPYPSTTGEALIVRREGDDLVAVSNLRGYPDAPLNHRLPADPQRLLAAKALAANASAMVRGADYRGRNVFGVARSVPGTPWLLVAKIDVEELRSEFVHELWLVLGAVFFFVTGTSWVGYVFWRKRFLWRQRAAENQAQVALARLGLVLRHANDAILL